MSIRVPSEWDTKRPSKAGHFRYGKTPEGILTDPSLSHAAVRVYGIMAMYVFEGATVKIGLRKIAGLMGVAKSTVHRIVEELIAAEYVRARRSGRGQRSVYELLSPVFGQKQGRETIIRSSPSGVPRMVSCSTEDVA